MAALTSSLYAQLAIPSDGSDGALIISNNTVIDLSQAVTGNWTNNNTANAGKGIYDPAKWAVVFKYSSVVISNGATLTFSNHPTHAPVVWLVGNDVTINGTLSLDGQNGNADLVNLSEPGPGGFRGGAEYSTGLSRSGGFGPGGYFDDYGEYGSGQPHSYGNLQIVPLIGGSGGAGSPQNGGGGGGAILIAAAGTISINGSIHSNGGNGGYLAYPGSGGAVRLIANQILGSGSIQAVSSTYSGRVRLEANTASTALNITPPSVAVAPVPLVIWPATNTPTVQIISVANLSTPSDPLAKMSPAGDDLTLATTNTVAIVLQTSNFPTNGTVNIYVKLRNYSQSIFQASFVSGNTNQAIWQLNTILPASHGVIQVRAVSN